MSVERFGGTRVLIAAEAARLMYEEGVKEYFTAKRLAAKRVLGKVEGKRTRYRPVSLPSNGEIRDALLALAEAAEGAGRTRKLFAMRVVALETMRELERFSPRLIGSVSTGHVRRGSDIDLSLFTDDDEAVELHLQSLGWRFETERVSIHKFGEIRDYLHHHVEARFPIELTVYPARELRFRPRSSTDGLPIVRLRSSAVESLLAREHPDAWRRYLADGTIEGLAEAMRETQEDAPVPGAFDGLVGELDLDIDLEPEEPCFAEPGEEDDPDQQYEPLPGFDQPFVDDMADARLATAAGNASPRRASSRT
jgi:hypothetical protein